MKHSFFLLSLALTFFVIGCSSVHKDIAPGKGSYRIKEPIQCVSYARSISGIPIRGDAHTWWHQAKGRYERGHKPKISAVFVLSKTSRMKYGHLSVVSAIVDARHIEVAHSNWGGDKKTRSVIYERMPVMDVSKNNDWSRVRFWHYPSRSYGRVYVASGFIYQPL